MRRKDDAQAGNRPSAIYQLIWQAIRARKQITCIYEGCHREVCPHILGYKTPGTEAVFVFQFGGESTSKLPPGGDWRCFDVATDDGGSAARRPLVQRNASQQNPDLHPVRRRRRQYAGHAGAPAAAAFRLACLAAAAAPRRVGRSAIGGALLLQPLAPLAERAQAQRVQSDEARRVAMIVGDLAFLERNEVLVVE